MVAPLRHRQTKEAETDMFDLQPPRHISTLHEGASSVVPWKIRLPRCCGSAKAHGAGAGPLPLTPNRLLLALKSCDVAPLASLLTEAQDRMSRLYRRLRIVLKRRRKQN